MVYDHTVTAKKEKCFESPHCKQPKWTRTGGKICYTLRYHITYNVLKVTFMSSSKPNIELLITLEKVDLTVLATRSFLA